MVRKDDKSNSNFIALDIGYGLQNWGFTEVQITLECSGLWRGFNGAVIVRSCGKN